MFSSCTLALYILKLLFFSRHFSVRYQFGCTLGGNCQIQKAKYTDFVETYFVFFHLAKLMYMRHIICMINDTYLFVTYLQGKKRRKKMLSLYEPEKDIAEENHRK